MYSCVCHNSDLCFWFGNSCVRSLWNVLGENILGCLLVFPVPSLGLGLLSHLWIFAFLFHLCLMMRRVHPVFRLCFVDVNKDWSVKSCVFVRSSIIAVPWRAAAFVWSVSISECWIRSIAIAVVRSRVRSASIVVWIVSSFETLLSLSAGTSVSVGSS